MFKTLTHMNSIKRGKSKSSTSRLQSWDDLIDMVSNERKPSTLSVFLNHLQNLRK